MENTLTKKQLKLFHKSDKTTIYLPEDNGFAEPYVIKTLTSDAPSNQDKSRLQNEYLITRDLSIIGVRRAIKVGKLDGKPALWLSYAPGITLSEYFSEKNISWTVFLEIAIKVTKLVFDIHQHHTIHNDISDQNIVINPNTKEVTLIDFDRAYRILGMPSFLMNADALESMHGTTGVEQAHRSIDFQKDLFALGIAFYKVIRGRLPYDSEEQNASMIDLNPDIRPVPPIDLNPEVPKVISDIIMKLLEKEEKNRYKSAAGLKADLEHCLKQIEVSNSIEPFQLALHDVTHGLAVALKHFGRRKELDALNKYFKQVCEGEHRFLLVSGKAGVGKTILVNQLKRNTTQEKSLFLNGNFNRYQRGIPYFAIIQAFQEFVYSILTQPDEQRLYWRNLIQQAVGDLGKSLVDIIPNLEELIGKQQDLTVLNGTEEQNRVQYVFQKLLQALATSDHPVVFFLDNLQWADGATLRLIKKIVTNPSMGYLLTVGVYRSEEVSNSSHPLMVLLKQLREEDLFISRMELKNLSEQETNEMVAQSLICSEELTIDLAKWIFDKSKGNLFHVVQLLKSLYEQKLLSFDLNTVDKGQEGGWSWDMKAIESAQIPTNIFSLLNKRILLLPQETRKILKLAACIGNPFNLELLQNFLKMDSAQLFMQLKPAILEEYIYAISNIDFEGEANQGDIAKANNFMFSHDHILHTLYRIIPSEQRKKIHLKFARIITSAENLEDNNLFFAVNHYTKSFELVKEHDERYMLAKLKLRAGQKAKIAGAYRPAFQFLKSSYSLLGKDSWQNEYNLTLAIYNETLESAYLSNNLKQAEQLAQTIISKALSPLGKVKAYEIRITLLVGQNKLKKALEIGLSILRQLNTKLPENPNVSNVLFNLLRIKAMLRNKETHELAYLPEMTDPYHIAASQIMANLINVAIASGSNLFPILVFNIVKLSLKYGNSPFSPIGYTSFGAILYLKLGDFEGGYQFGTLAKDLVSTSKYPSVKSKVSMIHTTLIFHLKNHIRNLFEKYYDGYQFGLEGGDVEYAALNLFMHSYMNFYSGKELDKVEELVASNGKITEYLNQETTLNWVRIVHQTVLNLRGKSKFPNQLKGIIYDEVVLLPIQKAANDNLGIFFYYYNDTILNYLFGHYSKAYKNFRQIENYLEMGIGMILIPYYKFYHSLIQLALYQTADKALQKKILKEVLKNQKFIKKYIKFAPMNHLHHYFLVEAECYRVQNKSKEAVEYYKRSIKEARKNKFINIEALANELAANYLLPRNRKLGQMHLQKSIEAYEQWGASAKVQEVEKRFAKYLTVEA